MQFVTLIFGTHRAHHNIQEHGVRIFVRICNLSVVRQWQLGVLGTLRAQKRVATSSEEERLAVVCSKTYQNEEAHALQNQIRSTFFGRGCRPEAEQMRTGHPARRGWCESAHRNYATAMQNKHGPVPASWGFAYVLAWRYCPAPLSLVTVARSRSRSGGTHQSSVGTLRNTPGTLPRDYSRPNRPNLLVCTGAQFYAQTIRSSRRSPPSTAPASVWPRVQLQAGPGEAAWAAVPRCGLRCPARGSGLERGKPGSPGSQRPSSLLLALCTPIVPLPSPFLPLLTSTRRSTVPFWYLGQGAPFRIFGGKVFFFVIQQTMPFCE
jgi:hypothetical protein